MATLSGRDVELLQGAMLELYEPRDLDGLRAVTPLVFKRAVPAAYFVWLESGQSQLLDLEGDGIVWEHPAGNGSRILRMGMELVNEHPFTAHVLTTGDLSPMRLSDFWTRRQQLASKLQKQVYGPMDIGRLMSIAILRGDRGGSLTLARPFRARDFSERDREMLRLLTPHFVQAVNAAERASANGMAETNALAGLGLTPREREIASWLARGSTNHEIASVLAMGARTVEKHVERILPKLGVENRTAAARVILGFGVPGAPAKALDVVRSHDPLRRVLRPTREPRDG